jgi:uncharacterized membrane protein
LLPIPIFWIFLFFDVGSFGKHKNTLSMMKALIFFTLAIIPGSHILHAPFTHIQKTVLTLIGVENESVAQTIRAHRVTILGKLIVVVLSAILSSARRVTVIWEDEVLAPDPKWLHHLNYRHQQKTLNNEDNRHCNRFPLRLISRRVCAKKVFHGIPSFNN